jgi:hypothetical protein
MAQQYAPATFPGMAGAGMGFAKGGPVKAGRGRDAQWGESKEAFDEPGVEKKARGGVLRRRPKPKKKAVAMAPPVPLEMDDQPPPPAGPAGATIPGGPAPGPTMPVGMKAGGKFIGRAIKHPGSLRRSLGAKKGENIPAGKLEAAAKKPGKLGKRARLAETLEKLRPKKKAKGGECKPDKMAAGGAAKQRRGFPKTEAPPKKARRFAEGGKVRGCGAAQKGCTFSGVF